MKDKRTYKHLKEHGEDMTHENEVKMEPGSLPYLIEMHKKEIWDWKQKEADWIKTNNLLEGSKRIIEELGAKIIDQIRIISELQYNNNTYKKEIEKLLAEKNK